MKIRTITIRRGDTLSAIAERIYGNSSLWKQLAEYNGIRDPEKLRVGQIIEVPPWYVLVDSATGPPRGLSGIVKEFGNIFDYLQDDGSVSPEWERSILVAVDVPFHLVLAWDPTTVVRRIRCHRKIADRFAGVLDRLVQTGAARYVRTFGGGFSVRSKRTMTTKLSTHAWGIAFDFNPETNRQGTAGTMHPDVVEAFQEFAFEWGGTWEGRSRDPMHFQYAMGY